MDLQLHLGCICMNVNKSGSEGGGSEGGVQQNDSTRAVLTPRVLFDFNVTERNLND